MKVSIIQNGRVLREHHHNGETYAEAPPAGDYAVRITNDSSARRMAVLSVDGINAVDGANAGFDGPGYVLAPWGMIDVPGWYRDGKEAAAFSFQEQGGSYAAQTGRGVQNVGVIGVAVFDEKVRPTVPPVIREEHHHHHYPRLWRRPDRPHPFWSSPTWCSEGAVRDATYSSSVAPESGPVLSVDSASLGSAAHAGSSIADVGTAYGQATAFHTVHVEFERASSIPAEVVTLRYATRERLKSWGVPVDEPLKTRPQAFPISQGCPPPPGWRG